MVDIPRVARSYFDGVILASVLRWTTPGEAWWGDHPDEQHESMVSLLHAGGATDAERTVLIPELLIAAALGKVPPTALEALRQAADEYLNGEVADDGAAGRGAAGRVPA